MANPTLLTMPMCVNADKNTIPPTDAGTSGLFSEELGFQDINSLPLASGGKAPNRRDFNGVFALLGGIAYACQRGQSFEWVNNLPYLAGCVVTDPLDGNKYNAKNDVAEGGSNPSLDPTNWEKFGTVDISGKANTDLDNLTPTGQDSFLKRDFTIIYPNGGTEANPATVTSNSRYVENNPFAGYYVYCEAEVLYNGVWENTGWFTWVGNNNDSLSRGFHAVQQDNDKIIAVVGNSSNLEKGITSGGTLTTVISISKITGARIKVWKVGKIPT